MKRHTQAAVILLVLSFVLVSCGYPDTPMTKLKGPNDQVELLFFFKRETTTKQMELFLNQTLSRPHADKPGHALPDGVSGTFLVRNEGFVGYAIEFYQEASQEQRADVKRTLESSGVVLRVYEDVVPSQLRNIASE